MSISQVLFTVICQKKNDKVEDSACIVSNVISLLFLGL